MRRPNAALSNAAMREGLMKHTHPSNPAGWNILAILHDRISACEEYRVIQPLQELEEKGHNIYLMNASAHLSRLKRRIDDLEGCDLLLLNRIVSDKGMEDVYKTVTARAFAKGTSSVVDFDDDFRNVHRSVHPGVLPDLSGFSAITVTTDHLRSAYGGMNKHIYVIPNLIQLRRFENLERELDGIVIGLSGSSTHILDWEPAARAIKRVLDERPEIKAFVSGLLPMELSGHPRVLIPGMVRKEYTVGGDLLVGYNHYPWLLKQVDILVCAVDPSDRFNWHKSPLKVLEGWAAGCAVIATGKPLPIYDEVITHGENGLLCYHDEDAYYRSLCRLLDDSNLMWRIRNNGKAEVRVRWGSDHTDRESIYNTILQRDRRKRERRNV